MVTQVPRIADCTVFVVAVVVVLTTCELVVFVIKLVL